MPKSAVLRIASAAVLALLAGPAMTSPAAAFVGLSDKQADEISEFIKCKTYLLRGDLASFEADPDCGKGPVTPVFLGASGDGEGHDHGRPYEDGYDNYGEKGVARLLYGNGNCTPL